MKQIIKISARIYLIANTALFFILLLTLDPLGSGIPFLLLVILASLISSIPACFLLIISFQCIRFLCRNTAACWSLLLIMTAVIASTPSFMILLFLGGWDFHFMWEISRLGMIVAYSALIFNCIAIHQLFKSFQHEQEQDLIID